VTLLTGTTGASRTASVAALTTAAGAVACGVCCVLPFALPAFAAASTGGALAWIGRAHGTMTLIASAIVVGAWVSVGAQSRLARRRPASTICMRWPWRPPFSRWRSCGHASNRT
jgi:hypothetical protein